MPAPANPFPGMNPYLQERWSDVHVTLLIYIRDALAEQLPADLSVHAEERVAVEAGSVKNYRADVAVVEEWRSGSPPVWAPDEPGDSALAMTKPIVVFVEPEIERWLEISDEFGEVITVVELLSPGNKSEPGARAYRKEQLDHLTAGVNLVEIDLIRGGEHVLAVPPRAFARPPAADYLVCVAPLRLGDPHRREIYPCSFREPLPTIRVPLRAGDPMVPLALQPLIDKCYQTGRYWQAAHLCELHPPLAGDDAAWVEQRLKAAGLK